MRSYKTEIPEYKVKSFIYQILKALDHMHRNGIFHRDIKPENVLIAEDTIKLADFGSCRGVYSKQPYTEYISTRWYRPPECLLTDGYYGAKMDLWGVGCVFYELLTTNPLFPGENEYDQISLIHNVLGTPGVEVLTDFEKKTKSIKIDFTPVKGTGLDDLFPSNVSEHAKDLIKKLLVYKAEDRITTKQALKHPYFKEFRKMESPSRNSPSPHSLRSFDADRAAGDEERGDLKLPLIKTNVKKLTDAQHNPSKASLIEKTSYQTKKAIQDNKKKYAIPKKKLYKSIF
jgi:renal tumor antigen